MQVVREASLGLVLGTMWTLSTKAETFEQLQAQEENKQKGVSGDAVEF